MIRRRTQPFHPTIIQEEWFGALYIHFHDYDLIVRCLLILLCARIYRSSCLALHEFLFVGKLGHIICHNPYHLFLILSLETSVSPTASSEIQRVISLMIFQHMSNSQLHFPLFTILLRSYLLSPLIAKANVEVYTSVIGPYKWYRKVNFTFEFKFLLLLETYLEKHLWPYALP